MPRLINPKFHFYGNPDPKGYPTAQKMTEAQEQIVLTSGLHQPEQDSLGNYLTDVLFNEYERCMLEIANAIGSISIDNDVLSGVASIGDALYAIRTKYLPLSGGTITGDLSVTKTITAPRSSIDSMALTYTSGFSCIVGDIIMRPNGEVYSCISPVTLPDDANFHTIIASFQPLVTKNVNYITVTVTDSSIFKIGDPVAYIDGVYVHARTDAPEHCAMGVCGAIIDAKSIVIVTHGILSVDLSLRKLIPASCPRVLYTGYNGELSFGTVGYANPIGTVLRELSDGTYDVMIHGGIVNQHIDARSDVFTADGTSPVFVLNERPVGKESMLLAVGGHVLSPEDWDLRSDSSIRLSSTPSNGAVVVVYYTVIRNDRPAQSIRKLKTVGFAPGETTAELRFEGPYDPEDSYSYKNPSRSMFLFTHTGPMLPASATDAGDYDIIDGHIILTTPPVDTLYVSGYAIVQNDSMTPSEDSVTGRHIQPGSIQDVHLSSALRHELSEMNLDIAKMESGYSSLLTNLQQLKLNRGIIDAGKIGESMIFMGPDADGTCKAAYYRGIAYCIRAGVLYASGDFTIWTTAAIEESTSNNSDIRAVRVCDDTLVVLKSSASSSVVYTLKDTSWSSLSAAANMQHVVYASDNYLLADNSGAYVFMLNGIWHTGNTFQARGSDPLTISDLSIVNGTVVATFSAGYCACADSIGGAFVTYSISSDMTLSNIVHDGTSYYAIGAYTDKRLWGCMYVSSDCVTWDRYHCSVPATSSGVLGASALGGSILAVFPNHLASVHSAAHELHCFTERVYLPESDTHDIRYRCAVTTDEVAPRLLVFMTTYVNGAESGMAVYAITP